MDGKEKIATSKRNFEPEKTRFTLASRRKTSTWTDKRRGRVGRGGNEKDLCRGSNAKKKTEKKVIRSPMDG